MGRLKGKSALVTAAGQGIGRASAISGNVNPTEFTVTTSLDDNCFPDPTP